MEEDAKAKLGFSTKGRGGGGGMALVGRGKQNVDYDNSKSGMGETMGIPVSLSPFVFQAILIEPNTIRTDAEIPSIESSANYPPNSNDVSYDLKVETV